jgi:hypothetical protein
MTQSALEARGKMEVYVQTFIIPAIDACEWSETNLFHCLESNADSPVVQSVAYSGTS